jgi:hypothetical protein
MSFTQPLDIAKRALQHLGQPTIAALSESNPQAVQMSLAYPLLRQAALRRSAFTFAARRAVIRSRTSTTFRITPLAWAIGTTYAVGDVVLDSLGYPWLSVRASNLANTPGQNGAGSIGVNPYWIAYFGPLVADLWASGTFFPGDVVYKTGSPAKAYIAIPGQGTAVAAQDPASGAPWHEIAGATVAAFVAHDPGSYSLSPSAVATTSVHRLIYDLPANFMRLAPQDAKAASTPRQFITSGETYNDWEIEGGLLFTADTAPIIFRFISDVSDVSSMEPLFCELLALDMAKETCMILTGNRELQAQLEGRHAAMAGDARTIALMEAGSTELESQAQPQQPQQAQR